MMPSLYLDAAELLEHTQHRTCDALTKTNRGAEIIPDRFLNTLAAVVHWDRSCAHAANDELRLTASVT